MYAAKCDNCGERWADMETGSIAFTDEHSIREQISNDEWLLKNGKDYCPECYYYDEEDNLVLKPVDKLNSK